MLLIPYQAIVKVRMIDGPSYPLNQRVVMLQDQTDYDKAIPTALLRRQRETLSMPNTMPAGVSRVATSAVMSANPTLCESREAVTPMSSSMNYHLFLAQP